jgi:hypothetical protein
MRRSVVISAVAIAIVAAGSGLLIGPNWQAAAQKTDRQAPTMTAELRKEIAQLKKDIASAPTTYANMNERAQVLWRWFNVISFTDLTVDPNLPNLVSLAAGISGQPEPKLNGVPVPKYVDNAVAELEMREADPNLFGSATLDGKGPFPAYSLQTLRVTYTVGTAGVADGGAIILGRHMMADGYAIQADDPAGENYVSITTSREGISFTPERVNMPGTLGRTLYTPDPLAFRLKGGALKKGDTVTLVYGDTAQGSPGLRMQSYSNDRVPLPVFVDPGQIENFTHQIFYVGAPSLVVVGGEVDSVHGFAPSVVKTGEPFEVAIRSQDKYYNRASLREGGSFPAYELTVNGEKLRSIAAGNEAITVLKDISFTKPGVYRIAISSPDGRIHGVVNPVLVEDNPITRVFWGETHAHSGMAEGMGSTKGFWTFGRDDARLDFLAHTDHDSMMDDAEWEEVRRNAIDYYQPGKFIPYLAYEWSSYYLVGGHHNVLYRTPEGRDRSPAQTAPTVTDMYFDLRSKNDPKDVVVIPHAHQPGDWRVSNAVLEPLIEVMSGHGTFDFFARVYLGNGHQVGFVGASDDHLSHPGYSIRWHIALGMMQQGGLAAVQAPEKSRDAIFDGMKSRRTYATTGDRVIMDVKLNGAGMGERIAYTPNRQMEGWIVGTSPLDTLSIYKNGEIVHETDFATFTDVKLPAETLTLQVGVGSESHPPEYAHAFPRESRLWSGYMEITGAELAKAEPLDFDNPHLQSMTRDENTPNKVIFKNATRGFLSAIGLTLRKVTPGAKLRVHIDASESIEALGVSAMNARTTVYPAQDINVSLTAMKGGKYMADANSPKGYKDVLLVRALKPNPVMDTKFTFTDSDAVTSGDYYYVRLRELNGTLVWTSPFWVGGHTAGAAFGTRR